MCLGVNCISYFRVCLACKRKFEERKRKERKEVEIEMLFPIKRKLFFNIFQRGF